MSDDNRRKRPDYTDAADLFACQKARITTDATLIQVSLMAGGWTRDGGVQEQIDSTVDDGVAEARARLKGAGPSLAFCEDCEAPIPERRRELIPGVRRCVACQAEADDAGAPGNMNRRASKDSLLR
tara:strand:+ start:94 stop:471 length:378 start_codon:yes stop_codon:yes gene_type:complete